MKHECTMQASFVFQCPSYEMVESGDRADVKKNRDLMELRKSRQCTAPSLFFMRFPNFAIPCMISNSEPNCLAWSRTVITANCNNMLLIISKYC